jgi:hypothetical protein
MTYGLWKAVLPLPVHSSHRLLRRLDPHPLLFFVAHDHPCWPRLPLHFTGLEAAVTADNLIIGKASIRRS